MAVSHDGFIEPHCLEGQQVQCSSTSCSALHRTLLLHITPPPSEVNLQCGRPGADKEWGNLLAPPLCKLKDHRIQSLLPLFWKKQKFKPGGRAKERATISNRDFKAPCQGSCMPHRKAALPRQALESRPKCSSIFKEKEL